MSKTNDNKKETKNVTSKSKKSEDKQIKKLRKKAEKIENRKEAKKEGKKNKDIPASFRISISRVLALIILVLVVIIIVLCLVDFTAVKNEIEYGNNLNELKRRLNKNLNDPQFTSVYGDNSLILAYDTEDFYIDLPDDLYEYKSNLAKSSVAILNNELVYMGTDRKLEKIANKKGIRTDYQLLNNMYIPTSDFEFNKETKTITGYTGKYEMLVIPSVIDQTEVNEIGDYAFYNSNLKVVIMPDTITKLGDSAFKNNDLVYTKFSANLSTIGNEAFYGNNLSQLELNEKILEIGSLAFACNSLETIDIKNEGVVLGSGCFTQNYVEKYFYKSFNSNDKYELVSYAGNSKKVEVPEGVQKIASYAFYRDNLGTNSKKYKAISQVGLPSTLAIISSHAFENNEIKHLNLPDSVQFVGQLAFSNNKISKLVFNNMENAYLGNACFNNNLLENDKAFIITNKYIPNFIETADIFGGTIVDELPPEEIIQLLELFKTSKEETVSDKAGIEEITNSSENTNIPEAPNVSGEVEAEVEIEEEDIEVEEDVKEITENPNEIKPDVVPESEQTATEETNENEEIQNEIINGYVEARKMQQFVTEGRALVSYAGKNKDKINIPYSITIISSSAFANMSINSAVISESVIEIESMAFSNNNLKNIVIPASVSTVGYDAFSNNPVEEITINGKTELPEGFNESLKKLTENIKFN